MTEIFLAFDAWSFAYLEGPMTRLAKGRGRSSRRPQAIVAVSQASDRLGGSQSRRTCPKIVFRPLWMAKLFDGHRLCEIARLVDVGSQGKRSVVRKKLQRQREDERCH
jgi:hypothetical protein